MRLVKVHYMPVNETGAIQSLCGRFLGCQMCFWRLKKSFFGDALSQSSEIFKMDIQTVNSSWWRVEWAQDPVHPIKSWKKGHPSAHPFSYFENDWTDCAKIWCVVMGSTAKCFVGMTSGSLCTCACAYHFSISQLPLDALFWNLACCYTHTLTMCLASHRFGNVYTRAHAVSSASL